MIDRNISPELIESLGFIETHFHTSGYVMFRMNSNCLNEWQDVYSCFKKLYALQFFGEVLPYMDDDHFYDIRSKETFKNSIEQIDYYLKACIYELIIYDKELVNKWEHVKMILEMYLKEEFEEAQ